MKKYTFRFEKVLSALLSFVMITSALPILSEGEEFVTTVPDWRIADLVVREDMEEHTEGDNVLVKAPDHWQLSNVQNTLIEAAVLDGKKVLAVSPDVKGYATFVMPVDEAEGGEVWVDTDIYLPDTFKKDGLRLQFGGRKDSKDKIDRVTLMFSDTGLLRAYQVPKSDGTSTNLNIYNGLEYNKWMSMSVHLDLNNQVTTIYINGVQVGESFDMKYKYDTNEDGEKAAFYMMGISNKDENATFYFDNLQISYGRRINEIGYLEEIVDLGESYSLPSTLNLEVNDGSIRPFPVSWEVDGLEYDTNTIGSYFYTGTIKQYPDPISLIIYVREREIESIPDTEVTVYKYTEYNLPDYVEAIMSDGSTKKVSVVWNDDCPTTDTLGTTTYTGNVVGYEEEVKLILSVIPYAVKKIDDVYDSAPVGAIYNLPDKVKAVLTDLKIIQADVSSWEGDSVDTSEPGVYHFKGEVEGYNGRVNLTVTVYEEDPDLENIMEKLEIYFNNVLTTGRDRSKYGLDKNVLFTVGMDRTTNDFSLWRGTSEDYPLANPTSQGPLLKAMQAMSLLTGDEKYEQAWEDVYRYMLEEHTNDNNGWIKWGDHILNRMDREDYDNFTTDEYSEAQTHQTETCFPDYDLLFSIDAEKTNYYIRNMWAGHFKNNIDKFLFTRHATVGGSWSKETLDNVFKVEIPPIEEIINTEADELTFLNAALDFSYAAVKLWENTGDTDALNFGYTILKCYWEARNKNTNLIPGQYAHRKGGLEPPIKDVYDRYYLVGIDRTKHGFPEFMDNDETNKDNQLTSHTNATHVMSCSFPRLVFHMADLIGGELGEEMENWGIRVVEALAKYQYNYDRGWIETGFTDGTSLIGYQCQYYTYYLRAGAVVGTENPTGDHAKVLLDAYEREDFENDTIWNCLRHICMGFTIGDIGDDLGVNCDVNLSTECQEPGVLMAVARMYELTKNEDYYKLAKKIAKNILDNKFIDGWFYKQSNYRHARLANPEPYALLYFLAATEGRTKSLPIYLGEAYGFQLNWKNDDGTFAKKYESKLFVQTLPGETLVQNVMPDSTYYKLNVGDKITIGVETYPYTAEDKTLEWYTDNEDCVLVKDGVVTALNEGTAIITAEAFSGAYSDITIVVEKEE